MNAPARKALRLGGVAVICGALAVGCVQLPELSAARATASPTVPVPLATKPQPAVQPASLTGTAPTVGAAPSIGIAGLDIESAVSQVYDRVSPSVVQLAVQGISQTARGSVPQAGEGTGIVLDDQGHILTNYHVVEGMSSIDVTMADGTTAPATLLGSDPGNDLAVVRVDVAKLGTAAGTLPAATLGDSDQVKPGQIAIAIGNPFGLGDTLTVGFVSAVNRTRDEGAASRPIRGMIQTDAPINPGNSGGALVNSRGEVIGITSSIDSPVEGSVGVGFAIPINTAKAVLQQMIAGQRIDHAYLGISGYDLTPALAQQIGLSTNEGVYLVHVIAGSPAEKAGLMGAVATNQTQRRNPRSQATPQAQPTPSVSKGGDVITAIDGRKVTKSDDISALLDAKRVGDTITIDIVRDGNTQTVTATLADWPIQ